jgi:hypothetical protein
MQTQDQTNTDKLLSKLTASRAKLRKLQSQVEAQKQTVEKDTAALARSLSGKPVTEAVAPAAVAQ